MPNQPRAHVYDQVVHVHGQVERPYMDNQAVDHCSRIPGRVCVRAWHDQPRRAFTDAPTLRQVHYSCIHNMVNVHQNIHNNNKYHMTSAVPPRQDPGGGQQQSNIYIQPCVFIILFIILYTTSQILCGLGSTATPGSWWRATTVEYIYIIIII